MIPETFLFKISLSFSIFDSLYPDITIFSVMFLPCRYIGSFDITLPRYWTDITFLLPWHIIILGLSLYRYIGVPLCNDIFGYLTAISLYREFRYNDSSTNDIIFLLLEHISLFYCSINMSNNLIYNGLLLKHYLGSILDISEFFYLGVVLYWESNFQVLWINNSSSVYLKHIWQEDV